MSTEVEYEDELLKRARRAYELGRLKHALVRAALLSGAVACVGTWLVHAQAWTFTPITFAIWAGVWWYGGVLLSSAHYGLAAGAVTFLLPLSWLRPCCRPGAMMQGPVCTMPEMCVLAGALVGLPLAALVLKRSEGRTWEAALGMALGVVSLASVKCGLLFLGEALGLLAGLALGIATASAFELWKPRNA
jgi:hypothetical protein